MADLHLFSGDSASDEDFQSEIMAKWNRKVQEKFEKEKKQIRRKRKNPLSTQAPNPKIPSKVSSPSSGGGGGGLMYSQKCTSTSLPAEGPSGFKFGDFENGDLQCSSHSIGDLVGIYSKNPGKIVSTPAGPIFDNPSGDLNTVPTLLTENPLDSVDDDGVGHVLDVSLSQSFPSGETTAGGCSESITTGIKKVESCGGGGDGVAIPGEFDTFSSYQDLQSAIEELEIKSYSSYISEVDAMKGNLGLSFTLDVNFQQYLKTISTSDDIYLKWQHESAGRGDPTPIKCNGIPFIFLNKCEYSCHRGKDKNKTYNDKRRKKERDSLTGASVGADLNEHMSAVMRKRKLNQPSIKVSCPARFNVKKLLYFPNYHAETTRQRKSMSKKLKEDLMEAKLDLESRHCPSNVAANDGGGGGGPSPVDVIDSASLNMDVKLVYLTKFPELSDHRNHFLGQAAGVGEKPDPRVVDHIKYLVRKGTKNKSEIDRSVTTFVQETLNFEGSLWLRNRFQPSHQTIRNIIKSVRAETRHSKFDQENLMELKKKWEKGANLSFQPKGARPKIEDILEKIENDLIGGDGGEWEEVDEVGDDHVMDNPVNERLCFVYQSDEMQRLYRLYAHRLVLLDATHKTCKYAIPLFFVVVQANVNFQVAGVIVVEDESADILEKALNIIKQWNPDVSPKYGMIDFDTGEILSLESVFPSIQVFLCDFHREQSWSRWVNLRKHGVFMIGDDIKARFRRIANAISMPEYEHALEDLRSWENYPGAVENYFENHWYPHHKRWCLVFRPNDLFRCNTNNGTERLNESLKYEELRKDDYKNCSLSDLMGLLIEVFLPKLYKKYVKLNVECSEFHKPYSSEIPKYLWNRPKPFVDHLLKKLGLVTPVMKSSVQVVTDSPRRIFNVQSIGAQDCQRHVHQVDFGDETFMCSCDCEDFRRLRLPCKHMLAVVESDIDISFSDLSPVLIDDIYTNIDQALIGNVSLPQPGLEQSQPGSSTIDRSSIVAPGGDGGGGGNDDVMVCGDLTASLPERRKSAKKVFEKKQQKVLNEMKVSVNDIWNIKKSENLDLVEHKVSELRRLLYEIKMKENDGELLAHTDGGDDDIPLSSYPGVPPRRQRDDELQIYDRLPVKSKKHPYSGRYGEVADVMKKQLMAKVPIPTDQSPNVLIDGTIDVNSTSLNLVMPSDTEDQHQVVRDLITEMIEDVTNQECQVNVNNQEDLVVPFVPRKTGRAMNVIETVEVIDEASNFNDSMEIDFIAEPLADLVLELSDDDSDHFAF